MIPRQKKRQSKTLAEGQEVEYSPPPPSQEYNAPPLIYASPTVDTLGDESTSMRSYATPRPPTQSTQGIRTTAALVNKSQQKETYSSSMWKEHTSQDQATRRISNKPQPPAEFQRPEYSMSVSIKRIPVAERSAFALNPAPSIEEVMQRRQWKKVSPSPQHLYWISKLQSMDHVRQLAFSPSVGSSSDILWPGDGDDSSKSKRRRSSSAPFSDGRYRSIDPVQATLKHLPPNPPLLSNKRHRLPMRADVGFPNATPEELRQKQQEINQETEWEEASPRLIVLVTSDDLGTAAVDHPLSSTDTWLAIPHAGPELVAAKRQNQLHFQSKRSPSTKSTTNNSNVEIGNRFSVLAPPLDATFSSSMGWRPRPFHDRPPGMRYTLISPIKLEFAVGNIEPLVCSLSLYALGGDLTGKTSEDFYFPAGNWKGRLQIDALQGDTGLMDQWLTRKQKALFAVDPLIIRKEDLYVVLKVYSVARLDLASAYLVGARGRSITRETEDGAPPDRKSWKKRLKKQVQKSKNPEDYVQQASYRASSIFETFGTQFLSPLCFGAVPLQTRGATDNYWPVGQVCEDMTLYCFPPTPESQDAFVQRLQTILLPSKQLNGDTTSSTRRASASSVGSDETPQKRKGFARFMSPKKPSKRNVDDEPKTSKIETSSPLPGKVSLYISDLGMDFLQSLLHVPKTMDDVPATLDDEGKVLPRLLADISGTSGIMMDPTKDGSDSKRSNLVRLPLNEKGYMDACDYREVWFLPPMRPKHHPVDIPPSERSLVNLLYMYPRVLRQPGLLDKQSRKDATSHSTRYSIRISLIENIADKQDSGIEVETTSLRNFHNPAPWAGPSFVKYVYTKIPRDGKSSADLKAGIPLQDEFKLQLPGTLDGNQFLRFTLYTIDFFDDLDDTSCTENVSSEEASLLTIKSIAETTIPLSTYGIRDPASGTKVATIIPNGVHRLALGDFQLQVESRIFSSVHVSDPSLAAALREFPISISGDSSAPGHTELALISREKRAGPPEKVMFAALFAAADPSALLCHFRTLLFLHTASLVRGDAQALNPAAEEKLVTDCMDSLLEVCEKVRTILTQNGGKDISHLQRFFKTALDAYDEGYFHTPHVVVAQLEDDDEVSEGPRIEPGDSVGDEKGDQELDAFDGGAIRKRKKGAFRNEIDSRISRTFSAMESPSSNVFIRTAYGATKTDRMRLEAELDAATGSFAHLVDDDETVVTFATGYTAGEARMAEAREAFEKVKSPKINGMEHSKATGQNIDTAASHDFSYKSLSETMIAQRVRTAAKVMLAPCVPPSFFKPSGPPTSSWQEEGGEAVRGLRSINEKKIARNHSESESIAIVGSDIEPEDFGSDNRMGIVSHLVQNGARFRSPYDCSLLCFSVNFDGSNPSAQIPLERAEFVYESILLLWLRSIYDFSASKGFSRGSLLILTASRKSDDIELEPAFQKFYDNMDMLLPLCLKSLALRVDLEAKTTESSSSTRAIIDAQHISIFESFFETVPLLLLREAMSGLDSGRKDYVLDCVLAKAEYIIEFLVALYAILHPAHTAVLTKKFFQSLRYAETEGIPSRSGFEWTEDNLHRVKCSRQLRLRAVEKLAVIPNFIALNYPMRFPTTMIPAKKVKATWAGQNMQYPTDSNSKFGNPKARTGELFPPSGWLAEILTKEALSISALSCEAVVAEAMAHAEEHQGKTPSPQASALKNRPTGSLKRDDLLMFQSIAIHGITCVHELLLRRHGMDRRFQKESTRARIASLFALPIFEKSLASVRWLSRMESTHRVRSLWLLCFTYVLQEAPENLLREAVKSYSHSEEIQIHRFVRLLRLGSSTFQSFIDQPRYCMFPSEIDPTISPWLLQESFNTICAVTIVVVEECAESTKASEQKKLIQGVLDLLLHILTTPQSTVTHLRAVGGAIQTLERFGAAAFVGSTESSLQHWIRVVLGLMNSIALSVRSIAVDFVVALLCSSFDVYGSIDELATIFATVLPEVAAREIGLCSVSGYIRSLDDVEKAVWPLRRSFADLEDANPLDDNRVDPQLSPLLSVFCRACQAILDGVLIELRLKGKTCDIVGTKVEPGAINSTINSYTFDADEESLFEAANFFVAESAPVQRIRWLLTLKTLHQAKEQWVEAGETLVLCARAMVDSMPHLASVWRPSRFPLWSDSRRSLWLSTVGEDLGIPERGNNQVMGFADQFLEPTTIFEQLIGTVDEAGKLQQPTIQLMCNFMIGLTKEAVFMYEKEEGLDGLAYSHLESLLMVLMEVLEEHGAQTTNFAKRSNTAGMIDRRRRHVEDEASLRRVIASISGHMTKIAERILRLETSSTTTKVRGAGAAVREFFFLRVLLSGEKPLRFTESTTLPTFLQWNSPWICRVPKAMVDKVLQTVGRDSGKLEETMCSAFAKPIRKALVRHGVPLGSIVFRLGNQSPSENDRSDMVYVDLGFVQAKGLDHGNGKNVAVASPSHQRHDFGAANYDGSNLLSKHFTYRKPPGTSEVISSTFVEVTVANSFPSPLSRQQALLMSEFGSNA